MSDQRRSPAPAVRVQVVGDWLEALGVVLAGLLTMTIVAALGLLLAGADALPGGAFGHVVAAVVVMAVSGTVDIRGGAGFIAQADAGITVVPLSVSLAGALAAAAVFLAPLRSRPHLTGRQLAARVARTALLWVLGLALVVPVARHTFVIPLGNDTVAGIVQALGISPEVGIRAGFPRALGLGLVWLLVVLAIALSVSHSVRLSGRSADWPTAVRPAARTMVLVLLGYAAAGVVAAVVVAATGDHPRQTAAVVFLGLPNLAWLALGVGLGGSWHGHVTGSIGLPMPPALASVLRTPGHQDTTLDLGALARYDGRVWLLPVVAALVLLAAAFTTAVRARPRPRPWQHALRTAVALAVTLLLVCLLTRVRARYGLSLLGVDSGDLGTLADLFGLGGAADQGLGGSVVLVPDLAVTIGLAAVWGLVTGFAGGLLATLVRVRDAAAEAP